ncbi:hypothetical protein A3Q56_03362, partial [Intoshia linei]
MQNQCFITTTQHPSKEKSQKSLPKNLAMIYFKVQIINDISCYAVLRINLLFHYLIGFLRGNRLAEKGINNILEQFDSVNNRADGIAPNNMNNDQMHQNDHQGNNFGPQNINNNHNFKNNDCYHQNDSNNNGYNDFDPNNMNNDQMHQNDHQGNN